jgi:hypothetical protein
MIAETSGASIKVGLLIAVTIIRQPLDYSPLCDPQPDPARLGSMDKNYLPGQWVLSGIDLI